MAEAKQGMMGRLPKNIRQIGTSMGNTRIYVEDYVYTYLHQSDEKEDWKHRGFVLLGRLERDREYARYFISGLIRLKDGFFRDGILEFDDGTWAFIYQEMKKYYEDLEIVGWGQDVSGASASLTAELERAHKQNFNIQKNVLLLLELVEGEEAFYVFEKNMLQRREGYYVYYEKNPQMQDYMMKNQQESQELNIPVGIPGESPVPGYRDVLLEKKKRVNAGRWNGVLYMTSLFLVLAVCVLGVSTVSNVEKMQNLENTVSWMSDKVEQENGQQSSAENVPAMSQNAQQEDGESRKEESDGGTAAGGVIADVQVDSLIKKQESESDSDGDENSDKDKRISDSDTNDSQESSDISSDSTKSEDVSADALTEAQTYLLQGYYIVQKGDSLVSISRKIYGTPDKADKLCELNGIDDMDKIYVGQKLQLP